MSKPSEKIQDIDGNVAELGTCDHCKNRRLIYARNHGDPYISELYPDEDSGCSDWCEPCWDNRKGDI